MIIISGLIAFIRSTQQEVDVLTYYQTPKDRSQELHSYATKVIVRIAGCLGLIGWIMIFLGYINPVASKLFL